MRPPLPINSVPSGIPCSVAWQCEPTVARQVVDLANRKRGAGASVPRDGPQGQDAFRVPSSISAKTKCHVSLEIIDLSESRIAESEQSESFV